MIHDRSFSTLGFVHDSDVLVKRLMRKTEQIAQNQTQWQWQSQSVCKATVELVNDTLLGDGCFFRDSVHCDDMPTISSAFIDVADNNIVFISPRFRDDRWTNETFICEFPDGNISIADPIVIDDRSMGSQPQYVTVITCPIAVGFYSAFLPKRLPDKFKVNLIKNSTRVQVYRDIPLCKAGWDKANYIAICTMVKNNDRFLEDWLLYYRYMGIDHVYVYDNSKDGTLLRVIERFIGLGFVTIIPWSHTFTPTKTYLEVQIAHENDCLWRHRHDTEWILKIDVDEFMQPMLGTETRLVDALHNYERSLPPSIAVIRVRNWFFGRPREGVPRKIATAGSVIERNPWRTPEPTGEGRGREKCFIRPQKVHYFKIHTMKLGGESLTVDPSSEIRLVHYRTENPRHRNFRIHRFIPDNSMVDLWTTINKWVLYTKDRVGMYGYRKHRHKT